MGGGGTVDSGSADRRTCLIGTNCQQFSYGREPSQAAHLGSERRSRSRALALRTLIDPGGPAT